MTISDHNQISGSQAARLISAENIIYHYGSGELAQQVLKGASLTVQSGEFVILAGPSGSGKSTLLTLIGALRKGQEGQLEVAGTDLMTCRENYLRLVRQKIGFVFQQHNLLGFLTAQQNVEMSLEMFDDYSASERHHMALNMLEHVGLRDKAHLYPAQLSVGQKQRVAIARSLVHNPQIILADEPTASLDSKTGIQVTEMLQKMVKEQGCAALVVTHDNRIFSYADRILHIEDGRIF